MVDRDALNRLYRYAYALAGTEADAYDLLQDSLERYLRHDRHDLDNPEAYLRRIIRNCFVDGLRNRGRHLQEPLEDGATEPQDIGTHTLESMMIDTDQVEWVWGQLDPRDRELLYLWAAEGMTAREIAEELGAPRGTVLSRIHRLRARLRTLAENQTPMTGGVSSP